MRERLIEHIRSNDNLNLDLQALEEYINGILEKEGVKYRGRLELGEFDFPARTYAELRLAAGNYLALKIILGKGEDLTGGVYYYLSVLKRQKIMPVIKSWN